MTDLRGGAFTLGLGLARPMAVVPAREAWSHDRLHRTLGLGRAFPVVTLPTGAAVVRDPAGGSVTASRRAPCQGEVDLGATSPSGTPRTSRLRDRDRGR